MKIHLVHNQKAGSSDSDHQRLILTMREAGHQVQLLPMDGNAEPSCCNLVVVAGGDGTVGSAMRRFHRTLASEAIPLAVVPMGTANNIASCLGVSVGLEQQISSWDKRKLECDVRCRPFYVGQVDDGREPAQFLEAVGLGLLTQLIRHGDEQKAQGNYLDHPADEVRLRRQDLLSLLADARPRHYQIEIDGQDFSGEYLLVEVMNIGRVGPGLELSPQSDPADDLFELVLVAPTERDLLAQFVNALLSGDTLAHPFVRAAGRQINLTGPAADIHIDDRRCEGQGDRSLSIRALAEPLRILV